MKEKYLPILTGLFVATLLLSNVTSSKIFAVGALAIPGGMILFPVVFIFNDIFTEVYGYARTRQIVWTGLFCQLFAACIYFIVLKLPPAPFWMEQPAFEKILGFIPRISIASLIAYACGEFTNSYILSRMKFIDNGNVGIKQGKRFIVSTVAGEFVDTVIVMVIAFAGVMPMIEILKSGAVIYLVKVCYEIIALPLSMKVTEWLKCAEGSDVIDNPEITDYNPLQF
jgi:queuosine precursor transporter